MTGRTVVLAVGGNALVPEGEAGSLSRQSERARQLAAVLVDLLSDGWQVVVTHGNGPQVGFIVRRGELVAAARTAEGLPDLPLWLAVADSQGGVGHLLALALDSELRAHDRPERAAAVLTHVEVDADDPAFAAPTKPIGGLLDEAGARAHASVDGWTVTETSPGHWRRVVPSPQPMSIVEVEPIGQLVRAGALVIAAGGGGIPIVRHQDGWLPVDAVVDKDRTAALLAAGLQASHLVIVTAVDEVAIGFGTPRQQGLSRVDAAAMREYLEAGEFPPGSMGPKVEACLRFLELGGTTAVITSLAALRAALDGRAGTHIHANRQES